MAKKNKAVKTPKLKFTVTHALVTLYTILMFTLFPLFLTNYYQSARRDKFWLYVVLTGVVGVAVAVILLANHLGKNTADKFSTYKDPFKLNITDIGILAFLGVTIISAIVATIAAPNPGEAFSKLLLGSYGRNMGLLMILTMAICYFCVSRFFYYSKYVIYFMFIGMTIMSFVAIVNFYHIDILGIFAKYQTNENVQINFTSTIGNKNYLSAMITVALPFSVGLAVATKDKILRIIAYVSTGLQFMGLLVATSDGGFLGCFAAFAVMLVILSRDMEKLSRFFFCLFIMMASAKLLWLFDLMMKGNNKGYTSFSEIFVYNNLVFVFIPLFFGLAVVCSKMQNKGIEKFAFIGSSALVITGIIAVVAMFIYYSAINTDTRLSGFSRFFRFDERWGTHRGFFWIKSFELMGDFNFFEVLFGSGPDTFYNVFRVYFDELLKRFGDSSTNAAHNVYINYLVTVGVFGLISYLLFIGSAIFNAVKNSKVNPLALMCVGVIIAYATQDIVNIANPVNTPWLIMFIALSESVRLRANSTERLLEEKF
ncbi:MAG: O-antigen ligase family protein [Clostridia bacterium]|nr:O-antigen ligase family protein [Clostridia bacterium]